MAWPEAQYQAWLRGVVNSLPNHPLAEVMNLKDSEILNVYDRHQESKVERAMLGTGLTLLQNGPAQFRDPVTGAAFTYVEKPDGSELHSGVSNRDGKPVTMSRTLPKRLSAGALASRGDVKDNFKRHPRLV